MEILDLCWRAVNLCFDPTDKRHRTRRAAERRYRPGAFALRTQSAASAMKKMKCGGDPRRNEFQWLKTRLVGN
jgi:hypothetical protein